MSFGDKVSDYIQEKIKSVERNIRKIIFAHQMI